MIVAPELDLPEAERVLMLPFQEDLAAFDGTEEDAFAEGLAPSAGAARQSEIQQSP